MRPQQTPTPMTTSSAWLLHLTDEEGGYNWRRQRMIEADGLWRVDMQALVASHDRIAVDIRHLSDLGSGAVRRT